ncbi:uncharacterized protein LOC128501401 isoform X2 [Spea bombifrons]|uniref:uncharacterized protein LOC128501401 isoform X2 n=1 Tax=Spea bombifrons TaxID=233779 RepID=UPI00234BEDD2|nr:uncharacterized protein LOC128501401 isoform X2 [Spea bombifrons]
MAAWRRGILLILHSHALVCLVSAGLELAAPTSQAFRLGDEARVPCTAKVDKPPINLLNFVLFWAFRGQNILRFDSKGVDDMSEPRRFFKAEDARTGDVSLHIRNVTLSDAGTYRCTVIYTPDRHDRDVRVTVYALPTIKTLQTLEKGDDTTTVLCEVTGFYPKAISVTLLSDGNALNDTVLTPFATNSDGTFNVNITKTFRKDEKPRSSSCEVRQEFLTLPLTRELTLLYKEKESYTTALALGVVAVLVLLGVVAFVFWHRKKRGGKTFAVGDIQGPPTWTAGEKMSLWCSVSDCAQDPGVKWIVTGKDGRRLALMEMPSLEAEDKEPLLSSEYAVTGEKKEKRGKKGVFDFISSLNFIPSVSRHLGSTVECVVTCAGKTEERTFTCISVYAKPQFSDPINLRASDAGDVQLCLNLRGFYPQGIDVTWSCDGEQSQDKFTTNHDGTFNLKSKRKIPADRFKDPAFKASVTWDHVSMAAPEAREISARDLHWRPEIEGVSVQKTPGGDRVELSCKISNVFPDVLAVKWFEKRNGGREIPVTDGEKFTFLEVTKERGPDRTFTYGSVVVCDKSQILDREFICRVEHPSLQKPIQASTGPLQLTDLMTFVINNIQGPPVLYVGEKVTLYCAASYCTKDVVVTWLVAEADGPAQEISEVRLGEDNRRGLLASGVYAAVRERTDPSDKDGLHDVTTSLSFTPSISKHKNVSLTCRVVCSGKSKEKTFHPKILYARPKAPGPVGFRLCGSREVICSLDIQGFYPQNIEVKWGENFDSAEHLRPNGLTYDLRSECKVAGDLFTDPNFKVKVSWKHDSMSGWESKQLSARDEGFPWRPQIEDILVPNVFNKRSAALTCAISRFFPSNLQVNWLRKEKDHEFLVTHGEKYRISNVTTERAADHTYSCTSCLMFTPSVKTEQGAEFVCVVDHPSLEKSVRKSTGALRMQGFPDVKNILYSGDRAALDVEGFYPREIVISWKVDSGDESRAVPSSSEFEKNEDGTFKVSSTCDLKTVDLSGDGPHTLTATVEHETVESPIRKSISLARNEKKAEAPLLIGLQDVTIISELPKENSVLESHLANQQTEQHMRFIVNAIQGPASWTHGEKVFLYCTASYCPKDVAVSWAITGGDGGSRKPEPMPSTEHTEPSDVEGLFNVSSSLTLIPSVQKHAEAAVSCRFVGDKKTKEKTFRPKSIHAKPTATKPINVSLSKSGDVTYLLGLEHFYPKDIKIGWTCGVGEPQENVISQEEFHENSDSTYSVQTKLTISGDRFRNSEFKVCVSWRHDSMESWESMETDAKDPEFKWRPEIQEIPVSGIFLFKSVTFQYNISKYFPDILTVNWFKKENGKDDLVPVTNLDKYRIPALSPRQQPDGSYSCEACLIYTPSLISEQGIEFICRVEHPSLTGPTEKRTGPLQVRAVPKIQPLKVIVDDAGEIQLSLEMQSFYPKDVQIEWSVQAHHSHHALESREQFVDNSDLTCGLISRCNVSGGFFTDPDVSVLVNWKRNSSQDSETHHLFWKYPDFPWRPQIGEIAVPNLWVGREVALSCTISRCLPSTVSAEWFSKPRGLDDLFPVRDDTMHAIPGMKIERESESSFSCTAFLTFLPTSDATDGHEFICRVHHPGLQKPIERTTGALRLMQTEAANMVTETDGVKCLPAVTTEKVVDKWNSVPAEVAEGMECDAETPRSKPFRKNASSARRNSEPQKVKTERVLPKPQKRKRSDEADAESLTEKRKKDCEEDSPLSDDNEDDQAEDDMDTN